MTQAKKSQGWEGWLAPAGLEFHSDGRGQAALPNPELFNQLGAFDLDLGTFNLGTLELDLSARSDRRRSAVFVQALSGKRGLRFGWSGDSAAVSVATPIVAVLLPGNHRLAFQSCPNEANQ